MACATCHKLGDKGGTIGPGLSAVGAGLPTELIVEALLWPQRQVKEGYLSSSLNLKDGRFLAGYLQRDDKTRVEILNIADNKRTTVLTANIASRTDAGSIMPDGLVAGLNEDELVALIAWLSRLRGDDQ